MTPEIGFIKSYITPLARQISFFRPSEIQQSLEKHHIKEWKEGPEAKGDEVDLEKGLYRNPSHLG